MHETGDGDPVGAHRRGTSHLTSASPARQERTLRAQPGMEARSAGEQGDRPRDGAPTVAEWWSVRIALRGMAGKADGFHAPDGRRPGGATAKPTGPHRGLRAGQVVTGGTRARGRARRLLATLSRTRRGTGGPRALARAGGGRPSTSRRRETKGGSRPGIAPPAPREAGPEGRRAVVVAHRPAGLHTKRRPARGGTKAHGPHGRAGEPGQNVGGRARPESPGAPTGRNAPSMEGRAGPSTSGAAGHDAGAPDRRGAVAGRLSPAAPRWRAGRGRAHSGGGRRRP
jgi:hypothetical protein